jgi:hypothetical protein
MPLTDNDLAELLALRVDQRDDVGAHAAEVSDQCECCGDSC